ncbi:MAG: hypothetical protein ABUL71_04095, partial [Gemmatimonadota bacterium]
MDNAVALVQAYLQVNGYFTVCEFPVLRSSTAIATQVVTDLDVLAFRFPNAAQDAGAAPPTRGTLRVALPDPVLGGSADKADMLIGEVKEGSARLNDGTTSAAAIAAALARFGCCPAQEAGAVANALVRHGETVLPSGHLLRLVAFGVAHGAERTGSARIVSLAHVVRFLRQHLQTNWETLRHVQFKDPALGM